MKSVDQQFNEWFDNKYPEGSLGNLPIMREGFKEIAYNAWIQALCSTNIRFVQEWNSAIEKHEFFFPE